MLTSYDSFLAKKVYLVGSILKETKLLDYKENITKKKKSQNKSRAEIWKIHQKQDQIIMIAMSLFENLHRTGVFLSGPSLVDRTITQVGTWWWMRTVWVAKLWAKLVTP